ncbi:MAG: ATP-dependent Clp protease proteolytic subunit [Acidaminococcales bacterium]|jgi:hypothetical protein|nr:ATP-dependent Clp protease proteolytic subunit [Acidaminococcales bacterium]
MSYKTRTPLYEKLEKMRQSKVLLYVTSTRPGLESRIGTDAADVFVEHLDRFYESGGRCAKISLIIHSYGGALLAGWRISNLLRMFCKELEIIVPYTALSTATLMAIGADKIIMTKQACIGPIDPTTNGPYNPAAPMPFSPNLPVSVEHVFGFLDLANKYENKTDLTKEAFLALARKVHPLAIGNVARSQTQIRMLAKKLLDKTGPNRDTAERDAIIRFLCSESGSHDYTIDRNEAKDLKLPVESPSKELYCVIKDIYNDFKEEMELNIPFNWVAELGNADKKDITAKRLLIESRLGGSHCIVTRGELYKVQLPPDSPPLPANMLPQVNFNIKKEGWEHAENKDDAATSKYSSKGGRKRKTEQ